MKISANFSSFVTSAKGMGAQKRKMDLIAENIANSNTTKTENGQAYKRKFLTMEKKGEVFGTNVAQIKLSMKSTGNNQFIKPIQLEQQRAELGSGVKVKVNEDTKEGSRVYMPDHPDADDEGYVNMPNVNVVTEMVDMISATRSYEANLTAFNASKSMAKNALEMG